MNIMIILEKIRKKDNIIECDYRNVDCGDQILGHVKYDITNKKYIDITYSESQDEELHIGFSHIERALERMLSINKFPETYHIVWY